MTYKPRSATSAPATQVPTRAASPAMVEMPAPQGEPAEPEELARLIEQALRQDPLTLQSLEASDSQAVALGEETGRVRALRQMNAARIVAPALRAALQGELDEERRVARFMQVLQNSRRAAEGVTRALGYDPTERSQRWFVNAVERSLMDVAAEVAQPSAELVTQFAKAVDLRRDEEPVWQEFAASTAVTLGLARALAPVIAAQERFDFFRNRDQDLETVRNLLLRTAAIAVQEACDPLTRPQERQTVFAVYLEEGGKLLADLWTRDTQRAQRAMQQQTRAQLEAWRRANPAGLPLDSLYSAFEQQMARLIRLSRQRRVQER